MTLFILVVLAVMIGNLGTSVLGELASEARAATARSSGPVLFPAAARANLTSASQQAPSYYLVGQSGRVYQVTMDPR